MLRKVGDECQLILEDCCHRTRDGLLGRPSAPSAIKSRGLEPSLHQPSRAMSESGSRCQLRQRTCEGTKATRRSCRVGISENALRPLRKLYRRFAIWIIRTRQIVREPRPPEYEPSKASWTTRFRFHYPIGILTVSLINTAVTVCPGMIGRGYPATGFAGPKSGICAFLPAAGLAAASDFWPGSTSRNARILAMWFKPVLHGRPIFSYSRQPSSFLES